MTISFDFDGVLRDLKKAQQLAIDLKKEGHTVLLVTTRYDEYMSDVRRVATLVDIEPKNVYNTNFVWKGEWFHAHGFYPDIHIDDTWTELQKAREFGIPTRFVLVTKVGWVDEVYNIIKGKK